MELDDADFECVPRKPVVSESLSLPAPEMGKRIQVALADHIPLSLSLVQSASTYSPLAVLFPAAHRARG